METVGISVDWAEDASRKELLIRLLWAIPLGIVLWVMFGGLGFLACFAILIQAAIILFTGKRNLAIADFFHRIYLRYALNACAYVYMLTDERAPLVPSSEMASAKLFYVFKEDASRKELLVRLVYWIPLAIVGWFLGVIAQFCAVGQFVAIAVTGERVKQLWELQALFLRYFANYSYYLFLETDERPPIIAQ